MKFKAKPKHEFLEERGDEQWVSRRMDEDGYVTGYLVDGHLVGEIIEATEEYINFEWWIPIDKSTLEPVTLKSESEDMIKFNEKQIELHKSNQCPRCANKLQECECEYELSEG